MEKKEFDERLILEVEANPLLYDKADRFYSDRNKKEETWRNVAFVLNVDVKLCKERWKNLRDTFSKYYKKDKNVPSGSQAYTKKPWSYFEIMKFLVPNIEVPRTIGNMTLGKENVYTSQSEIYEVPTTDASPIEYLEKENVPDAPAPKKRKRKSESETDRVLMALGQLNEPESTPIEKLYLSLAQRANSWSRKKKSKLESLTLQVFHEVEFEDENKSN